MPASVNEWGCSKSVHLRSVLCVCQEGVTRALLARPPTTVRVLII